MTNLIQSSDLASSSFGNSGTVGAGGLTVRTDVGSTVHTAILAATTAFKLVSCSVSSTGVVTLTLSDGTTIVSNEPAPPACV